MTGNMGLQLPQNESQGMNSRGSYTPTTEEDLDMIQVKSYFFFSFGRSTSFQLSRVTHPSDYQAQLGTTSLSSWVMVSVSDQGLPGPVSVEGVWVVKLQVRTRDGASIEAWKLDRGSRQQLRSVTPLGAPATQSLEKNRQCSCNRPGS